ncbi:MAG: AmmeMemoRadiSam system radical SAM enzyme [candidate division NC10 bacterium RBG_16_65_8]|nr:MAG: AmmeMemoRadiSam system radical SAM enzyme [candidate division NC10 bacterium RBG_16_65_8]
MPTTLKDVLSGLTAEGDLYERLPDRRVRCYACGHRCLIPEGRDGVCRVRFNRDGVLRVPHGYVATSLQLDPVEKKPFFHVLPGAAALSFGMLGCDYHCGYCQNWLTSQVLRDAEAVAGPSRIAPEDIVRRALDLHAPIVTSTYNEPLITSEWAVEVFRLAKARGLKTAYVSNGNATPEVLDYLRPWLDLYKVDLKGFDDANYRKLGGKLQTVLDTIQLLVAKGFWVEVVTLVVPDWNDGDEELRKIAGFLAGVSRDIPWHVTAFHPDYKMTNRTWTPVAAITRATEIGRSEGLRFVYAGNAPGRTGSLENTYCPGCGVLLIERVGFRVLANHLAAGACARCQTRIPGVWS